MTQLETCRCCDSEFYEKIDHLYTLIEGVPETTATPEVISLILAVNLELLCLLDKLIKKHISGRSRV